MDDNIIKKHKFIIICQNHYNPLGVIRSLGEKGIKTIVILMSDKEYFLPKSKYIEKLYRVKNVDEGLKVLIENYSNEIEKPFIYSSSDDVCCLLDTKYDLLKDNFFFFHGNAGGIITKYLDKGEINRLASSVGCNVLNYEVLRIGELPKKLKYPVITKAINSTLKAWKDEMHICYNENELLNAYSIMRSKKVLVQEYIEKKNELCLDGFSINGGENIYIPYYTNYLRFSDVSYGGYMLLKPFDNKEVLSKINKMLKIIGFTGIFEVEFLISEDDQLYFLEINFRNSTWSYAYTYGGYNMPYLWAKGTLEGSLDLSHIVPLSEFRAMAEYEDYEMAVENGNVSFKEWIKDFKRAEVHYWYNSDDPGPFSIHKFIIKKFIKNIYAKLTEGESHINSI